MKELILAIVTAIFPVEDKGDEPGYCQHEFTEAIRIGRRFEVVHHTQGRWIVTEDLFRTIDPAAEHEVFKITRRRFSWCETPFVSRRDEETNPSHCWGPLKPPAPPAPVAPGLL